MSHCFYSFRTRLTLLFGGLSLLVGGAMVVYLTHAATSRMTQGSGEILRGVARSMGYSLAENLRERDREMALLSQSPLLVKGDLKGAELRQWLDKAKHTYRYYAWIGVADSAGIVQSATSGLLEGESVQQRPWFINGQRGAFIGDVHEAVLLKKILPRQTGSEPFRFVDFSSPVLNQSGKLRGVLASHAHWSWVDEIIRGALMKGTVGEGIEALIVSNSGEILYPYSAIGNIAIPPDLPTDDSYGLILWKEKEKYLTTSIRVKSATATDLGWRVVLRQPLSMALAPVAELHEALLALGSLATAIFMLLAYRLAGEFSRPIERMADAAQRIQNGEERAEFSISTKTYELVHLAEALRGMAGTLLARRQALESSNVELEHKVADRTAELSSLYNHAPVGYYSAGSGGTILQINDRALEWLGYHREEIIEIKTSSDIISPCNEDSLSGKLALTREDKASLLADTHLIRKDGSIMPVRITSNSVFDEKGNIAFSRVAIMDVTELRRLEIELRSQEALNKAVIHSTANGLLLYREDGQCVLANKAAAEILGTTADQLMQKNFHNIQSWKDNGCYEGALKALDGHMTQLLVNTVSSFGKAVNSYLTLVPLQHDNSRMVLVVIRDVSELVQANRELEQLARHDALTGLHNRLATNEQLREEFLRMKRTGTKYSVLLMDFDHFKQVNDIYGHETGDQVLIHVAKILKESARITDFISRFGGEEFLAILPETGIDGAQVLAEKLRAAVADSTVPVVGKVTISAGLSIVETTDTNEDESVRRADQGLYQAKAKGRNRVEVFVATEASK